METIMNMPIQDRKFYIMKHNEENEGTRSAKQREQGTQTVQGESLNAFAKMEQNKSKGGK